MRASTLLGRGNVMGVRTEFRDAATQLQLLRKAYPAAADSLRLDMHVRSAGFRLIQECARVVADSSKRLPPGFTCEQMIPGLGRGGRGGRQNVPPLGRPKRP
jgi:hypothetical protein